MNNIKDELYFSVDQLLMDIRDYTEDDLIKEKIEIAEGKLFQLIKA